MPIRTGDYVRVLCVALVIAACLAGLAWFAWFHTPYPFDDEAFDKEAWGQLDSDQDRAHMLDDLIDNHLHKGMSRTSVVELLGDPDRHTPRTQEQDLAVALVYRVGFWPWHGMDDAVLAVWFGPDGLLTSAELLSYAAPGLTQEDIMGPPTPQRRS